METRCYYCGQEIHFNSNIRSKNGKFIPLQGGGRSTVTVEQAHDCPARPYYKHYKHTQYYNNNTWSWGNQKRWQQQQRGAPRGIRRISQYLAVLGLSPLCTNIEEIRQAYRKLALLYDPDRSKDDATATKFIEINDAYERCLEELTPE